MILSSADILRILGNDRIIGALAAIQIVDGSPPLSGEEGIYVYIDRYPQVGEFEATWRLWVIEYSDEPIDLVTEQIAKLLPGVQSRPTGLAVEMTTTELLSRSTEVRPTVQSATEQTVDLRAFEDRFQSLVEDVQDQMLLITPGRNGRDGVDGRDGRDGADGKDLLATEAKLEDLQNVEEGIRKERGQVLTWDGVKWTNLFVPVSTSGGAGLSRADVREVTGLDQSGAVIGHTDPSQSKISFDNASRTFSIEPAVVGGSYDVWLAGANKKTYTTKESIQLPNISGGYYIVFAPDGTLLVVAGNPDWPNHVLTGFVYWNALLGAKVYLGDERHGINMDWQVHEYLHRTRGAQLANGLQISNFTVTGTGNSDADATCEIANGTFFDEDVQVDIVHAASPVPNTWQQVLRGPARIPALWRSGATWELDPPSIFPAKSGPSRMGYNLNTAGNWSFVDVPNNQLTNVFLIATNNLNYPIMALVGQNYFTTLANARDVAFADLNLTGFITNEFRPLYNLIYQVSSSYTNGIKARLRDVVDIRTTDRTMAGGTGVIPLVLSDLGDVDTVTSPPSTGSYLVWNGLSWVPGGIVFTGGIDGGNFDP